MMAHVMLILLACCLFVVTLGPSSVVAQEASSVRAQAVIRPERVEPGKEAELVVIVQGARGGLRAPHVAADGLRFGFRGLSDMEFVKSPTVGATTQMTFSYSVAGDMPGTYDIPAIEVTTPAGVVRTNATRLTVTAAPKQPDPVPARPLPSTPVRSSYEPFLQVELGKTEFYVGEVVPVQVILISSYRTQLDAPELPQLEQPGFAFRRFPRRADQGTVSIDGNSYRTWMFRSQFSALKPGSLELGPATMKVEVLLPSVRTRFGFQRSERRQFALESIKVPVLVKPLPEEGQPEDFSGVVGHFNMDGRIAAPQDLHVGDPINIILTIEGTGNFGAVQCPRIADESGWRLYDPQTYEEPDRNSLGSNRIAFSQVIVPQEVQTSIPSFHFDYFDPELGRYVTIGTDSAPISMLPREVASGDADASASGVASLPIPEAAEKPVAEMTDILHVLGSAQWDRKVAASPQRRLLYLVPLGIALLSLALVPLSPLVRRWRQSETKPAEVDQKDILRNLKQGGLPPAEFLRRAREVAQTIPSGADDSGLRDEIESLYSGMRYAGEAVELDEAQRNRIFTELRNLIR